MTFKEITDLLYELDINGGEDSWEISSRLRELGYSSKEIRVCDGASKICLVFAHNDFVIKWAGEDAEQQYGEAVREAEIYEKAKAAGLERFFPKTEIFGEINGVSFVMQEKIDFSACEAPSAKSKKYHRIGQTVTYRVIAKMQKDFDKACPDGSYSRHLNEEWAGMVISLYGKKVAKALCQFIIKHQINDLHGNNLGYKNDRPIILDFSGYSRDSY